MRSSRTLVGGLATYTWLPATAPRSVLVVRTPYGAARHAGEALGWTGHGVGLVVQDVRGRHESPGDFVPYAEEAYDDGPALLAWVRSWADAPVVLLGTSYGAHAALATAAVCEPDAIVAVVPALGLGETARTRGGVLQLGSRLGWWLEHEVRRPWRDVVTARRHDTERARLVARLTCPLLALGGTSDFFAHDTYDLWAAWGGPAHLVLGPWDHALAGARRARRILGWLDAVLAGAAPQGVETVDHSGGVGRTPPPRAVVRLDPASAADDAQWCASLVLRGPDDLCREVAHGAALGPEITLGPVFAADLAVAGSVSVRVRADDFPRYARAPRHHRGAGRVPDHHLELIA